MVPERMKFLNRFNLFYQEIVNSVKENKVQERDFYIIVRAKCKSMNQERRERKVSLTNKKTCKFTGRAGK